MNAVPLTPPTRLASLKSVGRMRQKLLDYVAQGGTELDELPRAALVKVTVPPKAA